MQNNGSFFRISRIYVFWFILCWNFDLKSSANGPETDRKRTGKGPEMDRKQTKPVQINSLLESISILGNKRLILSENNSGIVRLSFCDSQEWLPKWVIWYESSVNLGTISWILSIELYMRKNSIHWFKLVIINCSISSIKIFVNPKPEVVTGSILDETGSEPEKSSEKRQLIFVFRQKHCQTLVGKISIFWWKCGFLIAFRRKLNIAPRKEDRRVT